MKHFYSLTYAQKTIWNIEKFYPNISVNNITGTLRFNEEFEFKLLEEAVNVLIQNNEAIRLRIQIDNGEPVQYVADYKYYPLNFFDLSQESDNQTFYVIEEQLTAKPFLVIDSDLFYLAYFKLPKETAIFLKFHHLIADAWSLSLIVDGILDNYLRLKNSGLIEDIKAPSYIDCISGEKNYLISEQFSRNKIFWQTKIKSIPEFVYLKNKPIQYSTKAKRFSFVIPEEISIKINQYCKAKGISIFVLFSAVFSVYINRTTWKNDIIIGTTVLNRLNHKEKNTIGMFVNTILFRLNIGEMMDFDSYVSYVYSEWKSVLRNQRYPFDLLIKEYRQKNQITGDLFDVAITYQNAVLHSIKGFNKVKGRWHPYGHQTNSLNIHINNRENSNTYVVNLDYLVELFTVDEIQNIYDHFMNLLVDALSFPSKPLIKLELLSESERNMLLYEFNNTQVPKNHERRIHCLFEEQVDKTPENIAVECGEQKITYRELDKNANQLANYLINEIKIQPDCFVGVFIDRSLDMIIAILGILKSGGAYVPIDTQLPEERIKFIIKDSSIQMILSSEKYSAILDKLKHECISLKETVFMNYEDTSPMILKRVDNSRPCVKVNASNIAYMIYTSGSTGTPKGVTVEHHSIYNFLFSIYNAYNQQISSEDNCLNLTNISFDVSVCEMFLPLLFGARLVLFESAKLENINLLSDTIINKYITFAYIPPTILEDLYHQLDKSNKKIHLNKILVGVEPIKDQVLEDYFNLNNSMMIINGYGPTEDTICSTFYHYQSHKPECKVVPIGKPIENTKIYMLDKNNMPVPIGVSAELCISGYGLARGYLNRIELTNEQFVENPFIHGEKMYRTGDLARWLPDGNIEFLGRIDNQVKIRGFRIELGEIESHLVKHEFIIEAIVEGKKDINGNKHLCAYFVSNQRLESIELKKYLSQFLPEYMIPSCFIQLEKVPLTPNGKIDRRNLPEPDNNIHIKTDYLAPQNEIERIMVSIWQEVLGVAQIGINNDFFELGGDSLAIIRILSITYNYNWNLNAQDIYEFPTIKELSGKIKGIVQNSESHEENDIITRINKDCIENIVISREKTEFKDILFTGATGFLGGHVLNKLLKKTSSNIYCIVRGKTITEAENRLLKTMQLYFPDTYNDSELKRIIVLNGDISEDSFNLSEEMYLYLTEKIDMVFHSAALVKHYGNFFDFEKANIIGTKKIIDFSFLGKKKRLNYISTIAVSGGNIVEQKEENPTFTENSFYIGQKYMDHVYIRSKFEAENYIYKAINSGLQANIFRVGNLTERKIDGQFQINFHENYFHRILQAIIFLGYIPIEVLDYSIDLTPVDYCSQAVFELMTLKDLYNKVFHLYNHKVIKVKDIIGVFNTLNVLIQGIDINAFEEILRETLKNKENEDKVSILTSSPIFREISDNKNKVQLNCDITQKYLKLIRFDWPEINYEYITQILRNLI